MQNLFPVQYSWLIPLLPLVGAAAAGFAGARWLRDRSHWPVWIGVGASAVLSVWMLVGMLRLWHDGHILSAHPHWFTWIRAGDFVVDAGAFIDPLTAVMLCVVTVVGFFICVFARGYMAGEEGYFRFFAYMGLFIFAMTCLVMADNFVMLYLGWEGVGLCSYLLIGYYYHRPAAVDAAKKAFIVNRIGDFGFALGIMLIFFVFGTVSYFGAGGISGPLTPLSAASPIIRFAPTVELYKDLIPIIPFLLMVGAFGKSAQVPLYVWLPDAMEGPTPVSALIHAATMVTAGVYMIARCGVLFMTSHTAMIAVATVGTLTALWAAVIALRQFDLKRVFAYSTISQLGYMFAGVGLLAPVAGVFHLVTHAFFKALLFLASGVVMHAMLGVLDMRKMSGLRHVMPWTHGLMLIGCLALAGVPPFAGFFSKDEILHAAFAENFSIGLVLLLTAFLTAYYTFRLYFRVFWGPEQIPQPEPAPDHDAHAAPGHETPHQREPRIMIVPLVVLAVGATVAGWLNYPPRANDLGSFLGESPSLRQSYFAAQELGPVAPRPFGLHTGPAQPSVSLMFISTLVALAGIALAYRLHYRNRMAAQRLADALEPLTGLIEAKFRVDEIYERAIVEPLRKLGRLCFAVDRFVIDALIFVVALVPQALGLTLKLSTQRGSLQGYALTMVIGLAIVLALVLW